MTILLIPSMGKVVNATYYDYATTVPAISDFESYSKKKVGTASAFNLVHSKPNFQLVSWIENTTSKNISNKNTYRTSGTKRMDFKRNNGSAYKNKNVRLNISTGPGVYFAVETSGVWKPS